MEMCCLEISWVLHRSGFIKSNKNGIKLEFWIESFVCVVVQLPLCCCRCEIELWDVGKFSYLNVTVHDLKASRVLIFIFEYFVLIKFHNHFDNTKIVGILFNRKFEDSKELPNLQHYDFVEHSIQNCKK